MNPHNPVQVLVADCWLAGMKPNETEKVVRATFPASETVPVLGIIVHIFTELDRLTEVLSKSKGLSNG